MTAYAHSPYNQGMPPAELNRNALVLYKQGPARIHETGAKRIVIEMTGGERLRVRPKDVILLHPGPIDNLDDLDNGTDLTGDLLAAWELLAGGVTNLEELLNLVTDDNTPAATWATWKLVMDGLYFSGDPDQIFVASADAVNQEQAARLARKREQEAWDAFLERVGKDTWLDADSGYLEDVAALALGQQDHSQLLRTLGKEQTPQNAHDFLLRLGYWDLTVNPYPARAGLSLASPDGNLPPLPDEARRDLTHLLALAIDDDGTADPDDAISIEDDRLWVHIADAGALILPDSDADREARARGANLYLPEKTVTMLPPVATQRLGLGLAEKSPALSIGFAVDEDGRIGAIEFVPSWVKVTRWTYEEAETHLQDPVPAGLLRMAQRYYARRKRNGLIAIELPEVRVVVREGVVEIRPLPALQSRDLVREAMLMAGEAVAIFAQENAIPIPYTVQDAPPSELPQGQTASVMFAKRKLLRPSRQSIEPGTHSGLGMERYAQVTSPLRRYLDLVIHQQLRTFLHYGQPLTEQEIGARIGASDQTRRDLRLTERLSRQHWTLAFLMQHPHWQGDGVVVEHHGRRYTVLLPELALETELYPRQEYALNASLTLEIQDVQLAFLTSRFHVPTLPRNHE